jgi:cob(I)alamin adenosyltransferase
MHISTKRGDAGYTSTLTGLRVPKNHLITEAVGALDEANSLLGLARASSKDKRMKRIILQAQKHLFAIGAYVSSAGVNARVKRVISEKDVRWVETLIDDLEEAMALPPGFVAFGQEKSSSQLDVARASVRKAERMIVRMKNEDMIKNPSVLRYMNRLSDLIFVLACYSEKDDEEKRKIGRTLLYSQLSDPSFRRLPIILISLILGLVISIFLILLFHNPAPEFSTSPAYKHLENMESMHSENSTD